MERFYPDISWLKIKLYQGNFFYDVLPLNKWFLCNLVEKYRCNDHFILMHKYILVGNCLTLI